MAAKVPDLAGLLLADDTGEVGSAETAIKAADRRASLAEHGVVGGDGEITDYVQHMATADGEAGHEGDDDLGHRADEALQVEDIETGDAVLAHIATFLVAADLLIAAGAKGEFPVVLWVGAAE